MAKLVVWCGRIVGLFRQLARLLYWVCCTCVVLFFAGRARAEPLRALVRVAEASDLALVARVRGQTSDLDVRLVTVEAADLEPSFAEQLGTGRALAEAQDATVIVWFVRKLPDLGVVIADLQADRVLVRAIGRGEGQLERSAQEEAAALVVRSAFKASLLGAALGAPEREIVAEAAQELPPPAPPPPGPARMARPAAPAAPREPVAVRLGLGGEGGIEAARPRAHFGVAARLALAQRRWEAGLRGGLGLASDVEITGDVAQVSLAQHRVGAYAGYAAIARETVRLVLSGGAGAHVFVTRTRPRSALFREREQRATVTALSLDAMLTYTPRWTGGRVGIALRVGCEAFPQPLVLGYDGPDFVRLARLWAVQPVWGLELALPLD